MIWSHRSVIYYARDYIGSAGAFQEDRAGHVFPTRSTTVHTFMIFCAGVAFEYFFFSNIKITVRSRHFKTR
jgi:hypothetical protein